MSQARCRPRCERYGIETRTLVPGYPDVIKALPVAAQLLHLPNFLADRSAKKKRHMEELLRVWKRLDDIGISRRRAAFRCRTLQRGRERADDVGEAPRLNDGISSEATAKRHASSLSIICCVMRVIPCGVVRNRFASSSGSSPTTSSFPGFERPDGSQHSSSTRKVHIHVRHDDGIFHGCVNDVHPGEKRSGAMQHQI